MNAVRLESFAAAAWIAQAAAVARAAGAGIAATTGLPAPAPLTTTGHETPVRWLLVGIAVGVCLVLLTCALALARRSRSDDRPEAPLNPDSARGDTGAQT